MVARMIDIPQFLAGYADRPFVWGSDDCSLFIADWWRANHGDDPAAHLRGSYSTEAGKAEIVAAAGGITNLVGEIAASVGAAVRYREYRPGDFGVIAPGIGAIYTGDFWAGRGEMGITFVQRARVWRAWSL